MKIKVILKHYFPSRNRGIVTYLCEIKLNICFLLTRREKRSIHKIPKMVVSSVVSHLHDVIYSLFNINF